MSEVYRKTIILMTQKSMQVVIIGTAIYILLGTLLAFSWPGISLISLV